MPNFNLHHEVPLHIGQTQPQFLPDESRARIARLSGLVSVEIKNGLAIHNTRSGNVRSNKRETI